MSPAVRLVWDIGAQLGEGPIWCPDEQALWFVDIKGGAVHRHSTATGTNESFATGGKPSFVVPEFGSGMIVGSESGIYRLINGKFGVRIEDCFHMTESGPEWFSVPPSSIDKPFG